MNPNFSPTLKSHRHICCNIEFQYHPTYHSTTIPKAITINISINASTSSSSSMLRWYSTEDEERENNGIFSLPPRNWQSEKLRNKINKEEKLAISKSKKKTARTKMNTATHKSWIVSNFFSFHRYGRGGVGAEYVAKSRRKTYSFGSEVLRCRKDAIRNGNSQRGNR